MFFFLLYFHHQYFLLKLFNYHVAIIIIKKRYQTFISVYLLTRLTLGEFTEKVFFLLLVLLNCPRCVFLVANSLKNDVNDITVCYSFKCESVFVYTTCVKLKARRIILCGPREHMIVLKIQIYAALYRKL